MPLVTRPISSSAQFRFEDAESVKASFTSAVDNMQQDADRFGGAIVWSELTIETSIEQIESDNIARTNPQVFYYGSIKLETQVVIGGKDAPRA